MLRRSSVFILVILFVLLLPLSVGAQVETPCLVEKSGRWKIEKNFNCVQMSPAQFLMYTKALRKLKYYQKDYQPAAEKIKIKYQLLDKRWKKSMANWEKQTTTGQLMIAEYKKIGKTWETAFFNLQKQKVPPKSWTENPLVWVFVGVAVTAAAAGLGWGLYSAVAKV